MLLGDYAYRPLSLYSEPGDVRVGDIVKNQLLVHVAAGLTLWDRLLVAADMPLTLSPTPEPDDGWTSDVVAVGIRCRRSALSVRGRLVGAARSPASLTLGGHVFVPTGNKDKYGGDGKVHGTPVLGFSGEIPMLAYAATAGVTSVARPASLTAPLARKLIFGGAVGLLLADKMLQIGPEVYGTTVMVGANRFSRTTTNVEGILGLRARLAAFVLGAGAGPGFTRGMGTPALRALLSVAYAPEPAAPPPPPPRLRRQSRRSPGSRPIAITMIPDRNDACPDEPGVASDDPAKNGLPAASA